MLAWASSAKHRRDGEPVGVGPALLAAVLSALLPGLGQLYAGRRRRAIPYLCFTVLNLGLGVAALLVGRVRILEMVVQQSWLTAALVGTGASLVVRAAAAIDAYGCLRPLLGPPRGLAAAGLLSLTAVVLVLALPHVIAVRDLRAQENLLTDVFADQSEAPVVPGPAPSADPTTQSPT